MRKYAPNFLLAMMAASLAFSPLVSVAQARTFELTIDETDINVTGRTRTAMTINGSVPGPTLRFKEGEDLVIRVTNKLNEDTSIHWHGLILPFQQDGVPGISFPGIKPGTTHTYRFPAQQSGTYWYHSHSGLQEQRGVYGSIIIEPKGREPFRYDREYVVVLSDWHDTRPERVLANLKKMSDYYNFGQRTVVDLFRDVSRMGFTAAVKDRVMWGNMRMAPTDIADVSGYTFLVNGKSPKQNWVGLFKPGERIRLRFINAAAMTYFDVRIPGLKMAVVQADGNNVRPVLVDEFRIAVAETYDVIIRPTANQAYTLFAEAMARTGYARATIAPRENMTAPIPAMRKRPLLSMADMGMAHGDMDHRSMRGMDHSRMQHAPASKSPDTKDRSMKDMDHSRMQHPPASKSPDTKGRSMKDMDHSRMQHAPASKSPDTKGRSMKDMDHSRMQHGPNAKAPANARRSANQMRSMQKSKPTMNQPNRRQDPFYAPGSGLMPSAANGGKFLSYADLKAVKPLYEQRKPTREITIRLTGNMERYFWSINGKKYSQAKPIRLKYGERVRFKFVNETMMTHPMHLHGMWTIIDNGSGRLNPVKHVVSVAPGTTVYTETEVDAPGKWAFHCHLLFHMATGMFREVIVEGGPNSAQPKTGE